MVDRKIKLKIINDLVCLCFVFFMLVSFYTEAYVYERMFEKLEDSPNQILNVTETEDGYIWIACSEGVIRFDGSESKLYNNVSKTETNLPIVKALLPSKDGRIWISSQYGLSLFDPKTEEFQYIQYPHDVTTTKFSIEQISYLDENTLILRSRKNGIYYYNVNSDNINKVSWFDNNNSRELWLQDVIVSENKIYHITKSTGLTVTTLDSTDDISSVVNVENITLDDDRFIKTYVNNQGVWLAGEKYLYLYSPSLELVGRFKYPKSKLNGSEQYIVTDILEFEPNGFMLSTFYSGILSFNNNKFDQDVSDENNVTTLSSDQKLRLFKDSYNSIWSAGFDSSLDRYIPEEQVVTKIVPTGSGLDKTSTVTNAIIFKDNNFLFGTPNGIAFNIEPDTVDENQREVNNFTVTSFLKIKSEYFAGTFDGLWRLDDKGRIEQQLIFSDEDESYVYSLYLDEKNHLWIGTDNGLFKSTHPYDTKGNVSFELIEKTFRTKIYSIVNINNDEVIVNTSSSDILIVDSETSEVRKVKGTSEYIEKSFVSIFVDERLWVSTDKGITSINLVSGEVNNFVPPANFGGKIIYSMIQAPFNNELFFLGTNRGLLFFDTNTTQFKKVFTNSALNKIEFTVNSGYVHENNIYMGTESGVVRIVPDRVTVLSTPPKVNILELDTLYEQMEVTFIELNELESITLPYEQNSFLLKFSAINSPHAHLLKYSYRLKGMSNSWLYSQHSFEDVNFAHLPFGTYRFQVRSSFDEMVWSPINELEIVITPPWWRSNLAYFIYVLIFSLIITIFLRERIRSIRALIEKNRHLRLKSTIFENTSESICVVDHQFHVIESNSAYNNTLEYGSNSTNGSRFNIFEINNNSAEITNKIKSDLNRLGSWRGELVVTTQLGRLLPIQLSIDTTSRNSNSAKREYVCTFSDITDRKKYEDELKQLSYYDSLTQLPNRTLFMEHLNIALKNYETKGLLFAIAYLDLDDFKKVNDFYGHTYGDELLVLVGNRLSDKFQSKILISRFGGDEFCILFNQRTKSKDFQLTLDTFLKSLHESFTTSFYIAEKSTKVRISPSIGVSIYPHHSNKLDLLFKYADIAMYSVKQLGGNNYTIFSDEMVTNIVPRVEVEVELIEAIKNAEIVPFLQPIVDSVTNDIIAFEVLARWIRPDGDIIRPDIFIPVAEKTGLIDDVFIILFTQVVTAWKEIEDSLQSTLSYISFNLSSNQIYSKALVDKIEVLAESFNITPGKILIEITESTFIADPIKAKLALNRLKKIGFNIALDDFGTGQSSLTHLKDFPVDKIKIDKSFVSVIQEDEDVAHIVESVILLAKKLQLGVIVEGVETELELNKINLLGGRYIQGYYYGKPEPIRQLICKHNGHE
ncbi:hypothetical protein GCM10007978_09220 [Shewanella hanedai]|uniref:EAL domain-containing protein n=1 Tax=Shewanella hanedai TaxID=25 RepID=A0A553JS05_SHEHA|nr:EAL domain-containing protein [Shewanella hanedai]TRY15237.1 EAL domain-containing protein [Shewanella hanedai]GGI73639.1 hypothetical protein GCM10007978_09220 [Shewanella hanedai]